MIAYFNISSRNLLRGLGVKNLNIILGLYSKWASAKLKSECYHVSQLVRLRWLSRSVYGLASFAQDCTFQFLLLSSRPAAKAAWRDWFCRRTSAMEGHCHCSSSHFPLQMTNLRGNHLYRLPHLHASHVLLLDLTLITLN